MKWIEFKREISSFTPSSPSYSVTDDQGDALMLYRGQANSSWKLETTLERRGHTNITFEQYGRWCESARHYMSNLELNTIPYDSKPVYCYDACLSGRFPNYEYLAFLRHHGFPSPLLDWSQSPYIAAFFAFRSVPKNVKKVAIFGYREFSQHCKMRSPAEATIFTLGPFASIHNRHLAQQSQYTYCIKEQNHHTVEICPHDECFTKTKPQYSGLTKQDILKKWVFDVEEREAVLADLYQMNINPFTMFLTTEAAAETAAMRILP